MTVGTWMVSGIGPGTPGSQVTLQHDRSGNLWTGTVMTLTVHGGITSSPHLELTMDNSPFSFSEEDWSVSIPVTTPSTIPPTHPYFSAATPPTFMAWLDEYGMPHSAVWDEDAWVYNGVRYELVDLERMTMPYQLFALVLPPNIDIDHVPDKWKR